MVIYYNIKQGAICYGERTSGKEVSDVYKSPFRSAPALANFAARELIREVYTGRNMALKYDMQSVDLLPNSMSRKETTETCGISRFFNRTLTLQLPSQRKMFSELISTFEKVVREKTALGTLDPGIKGMHLQTYQTQLLITIRQINMILFPELSETWSLWASKRQCFGADNDMVEIINVVADRGVSWENLEVAIQREQNMEKKRSPTFFCKENSLEIVCGFPHKRHSTNPSEVVSYNFYTPWSCDFVSHVIVFYL